MMGACPPSWQELHRKGSFDGIDGLCPPSWQELYRKGSFDGIDGIDGASPSFLARNCVEKARLMEWMELMGALPSFLAGTVWKRLV